MTGGGTSAAWKASPGTWRSGFAFFASTAGRTASPATSSRRQRCNEVNDVLDAGRQSSQRSFSPILIRSPKT